MLETALFPKQTILFPPPHIEKRRRHHMSVLVDRKSASEKILSALLEFDYLTAQQLTTLLYSSGSLTYVRAKLRALVAAKLVIALSGKSAGLPQLPQVLPQPGKRAPTPQILWGTPLGSGFVPRKNGRRQRTSFFSSTR